MPNKTTFKVGDSKTPSLAPNEDALRNRTADAERIETTLSAPATRPSPLGELALKKIPATQNVPLTSCVQTIWVVVYFDGTGNNMEADLPFSKHSNIAKLFRVRVDDDPRSGLYSFYIPGVATYFPEIGDDGGSTRGKVMGAMGEARVNYALKAIEERLLPHLERARAPANAIREINIAVFGFSRGSALARSFVNKFINSRCKIRNDKLIFQQGSWPVRFRFLGLFDTVASVGEPMSKNTTETLGAATSNLKRIIRKRLSDYPKTSPQSLAFALKGIAGADPAPGSSNGHRSYGSELLINSIVEEVQHFVAAHEIRNSFPVDSVSVFQRGRAIKPAHFHETVYPGVHSDVGGSYAPAEGGKSQASNDKLGVIPLLHMFQFAVRAGVPLMNPGKWKEPNHEDFDMSEKLRSSYNHYIKNIKPASNLGEAINNHMQYYFAWRFRTIRLKRAGDKTEASGIAAAASKFQKVSAPIDANLRKLQTDMDSANIRVSDLESQIREHQMDGDSEYTRENVEGLRLEHESAEAQYALTCQKFLKEKAHKDSLPDMANFQSKLDIYDRQLIEDIQFIQKELTKETWMFHMNSFSRSDLRPHYRAMLEAYEAEFFNGNGLRDETIIHFFNEYVHDSLAGFGADATLPSDPRVVYIGGDVKFSYANTENNLEMSNLA